MPIIVVNSLDEARKRYKAIKRGEPVERKRTVVCPLSAEQESVFMDQLAGILANVYRQEMEEAQKNDNHQA